MTEIPLAFLKDFYDLNARKSHKNTFQLSIIEFFCFASQTKYFNISIAYVRLAYVAISQRKLIFFFGELKAL